PAEPASARKPEARLRRGIADGPRGRPPRRGYGKCNPRPCGLGQDQAVLALVLRSRRWQALAAPSRADDKLWTFDRRGGTALAEDVVRACRVRVVVRFADANRHSGRAG